MSLGDSIASSLRRGNEMKEVLEGLLAEPVASRVQAAKNRTALLKRAAFLVDDLAWEASEHECCESAQYADLKHGAWCACCSGRCVVGQLETREAAKS